MTAALALQWGLLVAFLALLMTAVIAGKIWPRERPIAFAVGFLALTHVVYYALFLIWTDVLAGYGTMLYSIALRYQVLFTATLILGMSVLRKRWPI